MTTFDFVAALIKVLFIFALVVLMFAPVLTLAERKISAWMQDRIGPNRAHFINLGGKPFTAGGLWHTLADALKMFAKEWTMPAEADRLLFNIAPLLAMFPAIVQFAVIPFGPPIPVMGHTVPLQIANVNVGLLVVFALGSLGVYGAAMAGWASNNKFALLGALRASAQTISYEVVLGLTLVGLMMIFGSVQIDQMVVQQGAYLWGFVPKWGIVVQPLGFVLFFTAAMAENKRIPFDLPEGESEIIGYFVEYSSMGFGMFMAGEFIEMVVIAFLVSTLFLGGYLVPGLDYANWNPYVAAVFGFLVFMFKVVSMLFLQFVVRWALPRFRYDQLMRLSWKYMLPLAIANIAITGAALLVDSRDEVVTLVGLATLGIFVLSLYYRRTPAAHHVAPATAHAGAH